MNIIFTIVAAPLIGWFVSSRTGAVAIFLAAQSLLFSFQTLAVLLAWLSGEGGFGGASDQGAFGPVPTSLPLTYQEGDFWAYGLVNLAIVAVGVLLVVGLGHLRDRRRVRPAG